MNPNLETQLMQCVSLPSPPTIALRLLQLCESTDLVMEEIIELFRYDPALTARLLRAANSPIYGYRRKATTLHDAMLFLGVDGAVSLALTFTLPVLSPASLAAAAGSKSRHGELWRRSALSGLVGTEIARHVGLQDVERLFLVALLQDVGMLAFLQLAPERYPEILDSVTNHDELVTAERAEFGHSHAEAGGWLLRQWRLPDHICEVVEASDGRPDEIGAALDLGAVILARLIAEKLLANGIEDRDRAHVHQVAREIFGPGSSAWVPAVIDAVNIHIPELNQIFEATVINPNTRESILARARELLVTQQVKLAQQNTVLSRRSRDLEQRAEALEHKVNQDNLTQLHSREAFDSQLEDWFRASQDEHKPLSVIFLDTDNFKTVNDTYGHTIGDEALRTVARAMHHTCRGHDFAARYGGDEFVILLPDTTLRQATQVAKRLRKEVSRARIQGLKAKLRLTITAGVACSRHNGTICQSATALIDKADQALNQGKRAGRNTVRVSK